MKNLLYFLLIASFSFTACKKEQGCMDAIATNYNADAEEDDGSCNYSIVGVWTPYEVVVVGSQTVTMAGQTISSFDTSYTMSPAEAEIEGNIEFTTSGTVITSEDGVYETSNYTTNGNTLTVTDDDGPTVATYSVTKTNFNLIITDNQVDNEMGATVTSNSEMTIKCTRQ